MLLYALRQNAGRALWLWLPVRVPPNDGGVGVQASLNSLLAQAPSKKRVTAASTLGKHDRSNHRPLSSLSMSNHNFSSAIHHSAACHSPKRHSYSATRHNSPRRSSYRLQSTSM